MVRCLLACSDNQFKKWHRCPFVGRLLTPQFESCWLWHEYTGIDNSAYTNWQPTKFKHLLLKYSHNAKDTKWVCSPDVVGDWKATRRRFEDYVDVIRRLEYPVAYVLQDGQPSEEVPWDDIACVFLGGTDAFKESKEAISLCIQAKEKNKIVHVGRVNSLRRIQLFLSIMDSFDGLSYSYYSRAHIPQLVEFLRGQANAD